MAEFSSQQQWLRTAVKPKVQLADNMHWIKAIGPFSLAAEKALFKDKAIDVLVSKNSGGNATSAKLVAARERGIPVFMLERPSLPDAQVTLSNHQQCFDFIMDRFSNVIF